MATNNAINQHKPFPLFFTYLSASVANATGNAVLYDIAFDSTLFNDGSFNTATHVFTVPTTGIYLLNTSALYSNMTGRTYGTTRFYIDAGFVGGTFIPNTVVVGDQYQDQNNVVMKLTAAQTVKISAFVVGGAQTVGIISAGATDPRSWFSATLIG